MYGGGGERKEQHDAIRKGKGEGRCTTIRTDLGQAREGGEKALLIQPEVKEPIKAASEHMRFKITIQGARKPRSQRMEERTQTRIPAMSCTKRTIPRTKVSFYMALRGTQHTLTRGHMMLSPLKHSISKLCAGCW